jgi:hypothetical protein
MSITMKCLKRIEMWCGVGLSTITRSLVLRAPAWSASASMRARK